jgi:hypothetical protein
MNETVYLIVCGRCECEFDYAGPFTVGGALCERCAHSLRDDHAPMMPIYIDPATCEVPVGFEFPPSFR